MEVLIVNIDDVKPYEANPRINDAAVDAVATSLRESGFRQPIVVDQNMVIICGHTRWKAARKLGLSNVPVHVAKDLPPEKVKAYRIADNKTGELADWNMDLLPIELKDLQAAEFDLSMLGFGEEELAHLLDGDVQSGLTDPRLGTGQSVRCLSRARSITRSTHGSRVGPDVQDAERELASIWNLAEKEPGKLLMDNLSRLVTDE